MSENEVERLRQLMRQAPHNKLLRTGLIRRLVSLGEDGEALSLALELELDAVRATSDRRVLCDLFRRAELVELAEQVNDDGVSMLDEVPEFERPNVVPDDQDEQVPAVATGQSGKTPALRLVGRGDSDTPQPGSTDGSHEDHKVVFANVGGLEDVSRDIHRRIILPFAKPSLVQRYRKRIGGGVLLYGPPGCGKTLIARAAAGECGAHFSTAHMSEILDPYVGGSERRLSEMFSTVRMASPSILFFDEIDALGARRSTSTSSHIAQLASHFLAEMDGVDTSNDGVLVLSATNVPWAMDTAFLRPGRFDRMFFVPPPDEPTRQQIFDLELKGRLVADDIDTAALAATASWRSGADISAIVERASDLAIDATLDAGKDVPISQDMLMIAVEQTRSTVRDWMITAHGHAKNAEQAGRYEEVLTFLDRNSQD